MCQSLQIAKWAEGDFDNILIIFSQDLNMSSNTTYLKNLSVLSQTVIKILLSFRLEFSRILRHFKPHQISYPDISRLWSYARILKAHSHSMSGGSI